MQAFLPVSLLFRALILYHIYAQMSILRGLKVFEYTLYMSIMDFKSHIKTDAITFYVFFYDYVKK